MTAAKLLGLLPSGDMIIVRGGGDASRRIRPQVLPQRLAVVRDDDERMPSKLVRNLIARRKMAKK